MTEGVAVGVCTSFGPSGMAVSSSAMSKVALPFGRKYLWMSSESTNVPAVVSVSFFATEGGFFVMGLDRRTILTGIVLSLQASSVVSLTVRSMLTLIAVRTGLL
jgi:hypothetical protein